MTGHHRGLLAGGQIDRDDRPVLAHLLAQLGQLRIPPRNPAGAPTPAARHPSLLDLQRGQG
jgi:hypothetical protein